MEYTLIGIAIAGVLLSIYAGYVEYMFSKKKNYKAVCDINEKFFCTKVLSGPYGTTFGISNAVHGLIFYIVVIALILYNKLDFVFYLSIIGVLTSLYLAYIMKFKVKSICLVCTTIYVVNILLFIFSYASVY